MASGLLLGKDDRNEDEDFVRFIQNGSALVSWPFVILVTQVRLTVAILADIEFLWQLVIQIPIAAPR